MNAETPVVTSIVTVAKPRRAAHVRVPRVPSRLSRLLSDLGQQSL